MIISLLLAAMQPAHPTGNDIMLRSISAAQQGDLPRALAALEPLSDQQLSGHMANWTACMNGLADGVAPDATADRPPLLEDILGAYRRYWERAGMSPGNIEGPEAALLEELSAITGVTGDFDAVQTAMQEQLQEVGYHSLFGRTPPLLEFMAWKDQEQVDYEIDLPTGTQPVPVIFLDDFASEGWMAYATCGVSVSGGWTKPEAIYSNRARQGDLDAEPFRISLLHHEAQHHYDLRFADVIENWQLEYRAKLVELMHVEETLPRLLTHFTAGRSDDPAQPHPHANNRVIGGLLWKTGVRTAADLQALDRETIARAAEELLSESQQRMEAALAS